ncbi:hypothetical protein B0H13DRAFT_1925291 [Mycena leptocephala]|nr:hypothetical protein B0H13DRAFT_1925291 [Mycena leptocephala]
MDASAIQRFLDTNVQWPSNHFFIPDGGLPAFLQSNLCFKVFLVKMAVFPNTYATDTARSLTTPQRNELCYRMRDIVCHMLHPFTNMGQFFAVQIRQNEFRISYELPVIPSETAWMFHIIQVLLVIVGFVGEDKPVVNIGEGPKETMDGRIAHVQADFLLGAALSTFLAKKSGDKAHLDFPEYDANHWIFANFRCVRTFIAMYPPVVGGYIGIWAGLGPFTATRARLLGPHAICGPVFIWQAIALCPLRPPSFAPLLRCMAPEEGHTMPHVPISAPSIPPPSIPPPGTAPDTSTEPGVAAVDCDIAYHCPQFFSEDPVDRTIAYQCAQFFSEDRAAVYTRCRQYLSNHRPVCQYTSASRPLCQYPSTQAIEEALCLEGWGITGGVTCEMGPGTRRDPLEGFRDFRSQEKDKPA